MQQTPRGGSRNERNERDVGLAQAGGDIFLIQNTQLTEKDQERKVSSPGTRAKETLLRPLRDCPKDSSDLGDPTNQAAG